MEVPHFTFIDLLRGLISRSNIGLPRAKKDALCNSNLVPRPNIMITVSKSARDLIQWSLCFLRDPQALSSTLASLRASGLWVKCIETLDLVSN